jgi:hypothetical protein
MRKLIPFLLVALIPPACHAQEQHRHSTSFTMSDSENESCENQIRMFSDDRPHTVYAEETKSLPNQPLTATASRNGGISVRNWDKPEFAIKICKAAAGKSESEAQQLLSQISLNTQGGVVTVSGPEDENRGYDNDGPVWSASLVIFAPVGSTMDLTAHNGGISLVRVNANVTGHTQNGGISLTQSSGKAVVEARNGGISIKDCSGEVKATVQNGGISIKLSDDWQGAGLVASTHNGGVNVEIPKHFKSSLEIASTGHGSISCQSDACDSMQRTWNDDEHILRIGNSPAVVRATTVNGGIVVRDRTASRDTL